ELAVQAKDGAWTPIAIEDGGFEATDPLAHWQPGVRRHGRPASIAGWNATLDTANPASGKTPLRVEPAMRVLSQELFTGAPAPGETVELPLGDGLRARVPIA